MPEVPTMTRHSLSRRSLLAAIVFLSFPPLAGSQAPNTPERRAILTVRIHGNARLTVDGAPTQQKGTLRHFHSPPLEPGKSYHYTFVAKWNPKYDYETYIATREVHVEAGKLVTVDLRELKPEKGDTIEIIYVPTPRKTVDAMMKLAKVGKEDVVYDLGCGDGRIIVTAVKKFNAKRGVGVDLNPERIKEAKESAKKEGVADKVEFRKGDVFQVKDISKATVVMVYLSDDLNQQLRRTLFKQLKPGTRIVSHRFTMGDWKAEKTETVEVEDDIPEEKIIRLWTIEKE
jgi:uncharacterized protein (TIGR03000 family)